MSSQEKQLRIVKRADAAMERAAERLRATGQLERRDFLRLGAVTLGSALLAACNSEGPKWADRWLKLAEKNNEKVERWLFSHTSMNMGSPGAYLAGDKFPSYFISTTVPVWDYTKGLWCTSARAFAGKAGVQKYQISDAHNFFAGAERWVLVRYRV